MFDHVTIRVSDAVASRAFYELPLGPSAHDEWDDFSLYEGEPTRGLHVAFVAHSASRASSTGPSDSRTAGSTTSGSASPTTPSPSSAASPRPPATAATAGPASAHPELVPIIEAAKRVVLNRSGRRLSHAKLLTAEKDIATIAGQLADLTRTVTAMETKLRTLGERADREQERAEEQRERTEIQQERIDLAARELAEVSARLQAAADALRASI